MIQRKTTLLLVFILHFSITTIATDLQNDYSRLPDSYGEGELDDMVDWSAHPCKRECHDNEPSKICRYGLTIEMYMTMSHACFKCPFVKEDCFRTHCVVGDGKERIVYVANRKLPSLVCKGDTLLIDVKNNMEAEITSIHWHGMHQRETPFMDGVPYITQCPILPGQTFRYNFSAHIAGTFIWHSHSGSILSSFNHPFHLHGYYFHVVAMEKVNKILTIEDVKILDREGKIKRNLYDAPLKDTLHPLQGGYAVLRFYADNPGYWFFHCHYDVHIKNGMSLIFKVGEHEQFQKIPIDFPKC